MRETFTWKMLGKLSFTPAAKLATFIRSRSNVAHCDGETGEEPNALLDSINENKAPKMKAPIQFEDLANVMGQGSVQTFDGVRFVYGKQVNLNSQISHL